MEKLRGVPCPVIFVARRTLANPKVRGWVAVTSLDLNVELANPKANPCTAVFARPEALVNPSVTGCDFSVVARLRRENPTVRDVDRFWLREAPPAAGLRATRIPMFGIAMDAVTVFVPEAPATACAKSAVSLDGEVFCPVGPFEFCRCVPNSSE